MDELATQNTIKTSQTVLLELQWAFIFERLTGLWQTHTVKLLFLMQQCVGQGFSDVAQNIRVMKLKWTLTYKYDHRKLLPTGWHFSCMHYATEMIQPVQRHRFTDAGREKGSNCSYIWHQKIIAVLLAVDSFFPPTPQYGKKTKTKHVGSELSERFLAPYKSVSFTVQQPK